MKNPAAWIFGSAGRDFCALNLGGLAAFAFVWLAPLDAAWAGPVLFFCMATIDTGHMYSTVWRTHFRIEELKSTKLYWGAPLTVFLVALVWITARVPYLLTAVLYATIYHHMRQYYGVVRWYEKLNRRFSGASKFFIHALFALPLLAAHFNPRGISQIFNTGDLLLYPHPGLYAATTTIYLTVLAAWLAYEITTWTRGHREPNRALAIGLPMLFTGVGCYFGRSTPQILLPLVCTHGVAYFSLMALSLERLEPKRYPSVGIPFAGIVAFAAVAGYSALYFEERFMDAGYSTEALTFNEATVMALLLVPTVCHYLFDAWIWTGRHREARIVFATRFGTATRKQ